MVERRGDVGVGVHEGRLSPGRIGRAVIGVGKPEIDDGVADHRGGNPLKCVRAPGFVAVGNAVHSVVGDDEVTRYGVENHAGGVAEPRGHLTDARDRGDAVIVGQRHVVDRVAGLAGVVGDPRPAHFPRGWFRDDAPLAVLGDSVEFRPDVEQHVVFVRGGEAGADRQLERRVFPVGDGEGERKGVLQGEGRRGGRADLQEGDLFVSAKA